MKRVFIIVLNYFCLKQNQMLIDLAMLAQILYGHIGTDCIYVKGKDHKARKINSLLNLLHFRLRKSAKLAQEYSNLPKIKILKLLVPMFMRISYITEKDIPNPDH